MRSPMRASRFSTRGRCTSPSASGARAAGAASPRRAWFLPKLLAVVAGVSLVGWALLYLVGPEGVAAILPGGADDVDALAALHHRIQEVQQLGRHGVVVTSSVALDHVGGGPVKRAGQGQRDRSRAEPAASARCHSGAEPM